jgi:AbrB family looped-hinge helix DNA binding protein
MPRVHIKMGPHGRVVIPAEYRRSLAINPGEDVVLILEPDSVRLMTHRAAIARAQTLCAPIRRKRGKSLVDEFLAERRAETRRERAKR